MLSSEQVEEPRGRKGPGQAPGPASAAGCGLAAVRAPAATEPRGVDVRGVPRPSFCFVRRRPLVSACPGPLPPPGGCCYCGAAARGCPPTTGQGGRGPAGLPPPAGTKAPRGCSKRAA